MSDHLNLIRTGHCPMSQHIGVKTAGQIFSISQKDFILEI